MLSFSYTGPNQDNIYRKTLPRADRDLDVETTVSKRLAIMQEGTLTMRSMGSFFAASRLIALESPALPSTQKPT